MRWRRGWRRRRGPQAQEERNYWATALGAAWAPLPFLLLARGDEDLRPHRARLFKRTRLLLLLLLGAQAQRVVNHGGVGRVGGGPRGGVPHPPPFARLPRGGAARGAGRGEAAVLATAAARTPAAAAASLRGPGAPLPLPPAPLRLPPCSSGGLDRVPTLKDGGAVGRRRRVRPHARRHEEGLAGRGRNAAAGAPAAPPRLWLDDDALLRLEASREGGGRALRRRRLSKRCSRPAALGKERRLRRR